MATKKPPVKGRGLDAILGDINIDAIQTKASVTAAISLIPIDKIEANPFQPRKEFDEDALKELSQSIKQQGVITPVTVRQMPDGKYQLIAGERRIRASKMAGLKEVPAYVRVATDGQMMEMALVENIQRENLNAMEVAFSYNALIEECSLTHEQLSERLGKSRSVITNYLRLLALPAETQLALQQDAISMAHARVLAGVKDIDRHTAILHAVIEKGLSVHDTEEMAKVTAKPKVTAKADKKQSLPKAYTEACSGLKKYLQSEVEVKRNNRGKGTLTIHFNTDADFERLIGLLKK
ncbi:MAG: ParB/RepB/Spo0J family partition protein [Bacteroidales bacterium]|nr:ParB/RepB/Spo0J family partition protein [Bacteroidales bacterium]